jgi:oligopeptide/dipeptide ABC transporter ATP-binding protein
MSQMLISVRHLSTHFSTEQGLAKAVQDVSFDIPRAKTLALVGESGCGKSVTALSILRLIPDPPGRIVAGEILLEGRSLLNLSPRQMRSIRGNEIAMIFQEPMTSLNPVFTVGSQIIEVIRLHQKKTAKEARQTAVEMLSKVGIADPHKRIDEYPHQMSGGMRQRAMIAMALSCTPKLLIADEPTTALDVTIQAQILDLLGQLQRQQQMSILLITHDLGVVAETADQVVVMYASKIAETASVEALFAQPLHPYTQWLLRSLPKMNERKDRLEVIGGSVPNPVDFPFGCKFHPRCPIGKNDRRCQTVEPPLKEVQPGRRVACWYAPGYDQEKSATTR